VSQSIRTTRPSTDIRFAGEIRGPGCRLAVGGLRERPAVPRASRVEEEGVQVAPAGEAGYVDRRELADRGSGLVQGRDQLQRLPAEPLVRVGAERVRAAGQKREDRDSVPAAKTAHELAAPGRNRCCHGLQARSVPEFSRRAQRALEPPERPLPRVAKPVLAVEIIDRDEMA
jgi:hypothetical protein